MSANEFPTIVLIGGEMTLEDGSVVDSRQPADPQMLIAMQKALTSCPEWWATVESIVIPTLDDSKGGFAFTHQLSLARVGQDGRLRRTRLPRYPRQQGAYDYIYNPRTLKDAKNNRPFQSHARIVIDSLGSIVRNADGSFPQKEMIVCPDTVSVREHLRLFLSEEHRSHPPEEEDRVWHGHLKLAVLRADCKVTGLVRRREWQSPAELEAARVLLLKRFDLKLGLWDLALNPVLRSTVLEAVPVQEAPKTTAKPPARAKRRAEQQNGEVLRFLHKYLSDVGWVLGAHAAELYHPILEKHYSQSDYKDWQQHPFLRVELDHGRVGVKIWNYHYNRFDINAFVDKRLTEFETIAPLPQRKRFSAKWSQFNASHRKAGEVAYEPGRHLDDQRWVLLWSVDQGWGNLAADWTPVANAIADRTPGWVRLLRDAIAEFPSLDRHR